MFCMHVCLCCRGTSATNGGWKRASEPLELELQVVVSHHEGSGNLNTCPLEEQLELLTTVSDLFSAILQELLLL